jgi:hypothetical protein
MREPPAGKSSGDVGPVVGTIAAVRVSNAKYERGMVNPKRNSPSFLSRILRGFALMILGAIIPYFIVWALPGPRITGLILFADRDPLGPTCPAYTVLVFTAPDETIDYVHFEIQFPEKIGNHRLTAQSFRDVGAFGQVHPGAPITTPITVDRYCNFDDEQQQLPSPIDYKWYDQPASKLVVNAYDFSSPIMGMFTVPRMLEPDPISRVYADAEYRYTKWNFSIRKKFKFVVNDNRNFKIQ